jgi:hypothetical protein
MNPLKGSTIDATFEHVAIEMLPAALLRKSQKNERIRARPQLKGRM